MTLDKIDVFQNAYRLAWTGFSHFESLTTDEQKSGPYKIREYIEILVDAGESDPEK